MEAEKKILHATDKSDSDAAGHADFVFFCPGCKDWHGFFTNQVNGVGPIWEFNGNMEKPTFKPSLLIRGTVPVTDAEAEQIMRGVKFEPVPFVCHTFITDGQIQFLGDCTHEFAGKTVAMEKF